MPADSANQSVDLASMYEACNTANQRRILRRLQELLSSRDICLQGYLPPQRRLAEMLDISTPTLKQILIQLESHGVVERVAGGKRIIVKRPNRSLAILSNTIVMLVSVPHAVDHDHIPPGDINTIHLSINQQSGQRNINTLQLCMERLGSGDLDELIGSRPMGFVVLADTCSHLDLSPILDRIRETGIPLVVHGYGPQFERCHTVQSDHEAGAYLLAKYLLDRGHRDIVRYWELRQFSGDYPHWLRMRDRGYERAVMESGLEPIPPVVCQALPFDVHSEQEFQSRVQFTAGSLISYLALGRSADAIMALTDEHVFSLASACRQFGRHVHQDVAVVGYDNYWSDSNERQYESTVPLATIDKRNYEIGRQITHLLLEVAAGRTGHDTVHYTVQPELVICE